MRHGRTSTAVIVLIAAGLLTGACATKKTESVGGEDPTVSMRAPESVKGNVVTLELASTNIKIVKADGDTSGTTGHYHVFIDRDPVAAGAVVPKEAGVVHSTDAQTKIMGLSPGEHRFAVVLGDGSHVRIGDAVATATVSVAGPSVDASAPATVAAGQAVPLTFKVTGATLVAADGDTSGASGHLHVFIDRDPILSGPIPKEAGIVHTIETSYAVPGLAAGEHTIWVVLGDGTHVSFADPVMDKVTVTVS